MKTLSIEDILAPRPWPTETVEVPEWGGSVTVRALSATELDAFNASVVRTKGNNVEVNRNNYRAKLVARCVVNGDGKTPMFKDEAQIIALGMQPASALDRILTVVNRLNGTTEEEQEELIKNSASDRPA